MNPFNRLPGSRREPSGLEWRVLKKMPAMLMAGSLGSIGFILLLRSGWLDVSGEAAAHAEFSTVGLLLSFWIIALTVALGCIIVVVMKGHAYVRDPYPLPEQQERPPLKGRDD